MNNKNCCVIGYPIRHSLSPVIHNTLYGIYGIDCTYSIVEVKPGGIGRFVEEIPQRNICGFNVTMPYKKEIIPYLADAPKRDSINTVAVRDGKLIGTSTDEAGFFRSLQEMGFGYKNQNIVFIGAGAVTGALARDAAQKGARKISLINRTTSHAQKIADEVGGTAELFDASKTYECIRDCGILINTTPLGMAGAQNFESFEFIKNLQPDALVCDLIYSPLETKFLRHAAKQGNKTLGGISMLIWQAFYAFEHFFEILPTEQDKEPVLEQIKKHLEKRASQN